MSVEPMTHPWLRFARRQSYNSRRHIASNGWDSYSPKGSLLSLPSLRIPPGRVWARDDLEEEMLSVRAMKHVWKVKANCTTEEWRVLLSPIGPYNNATSRTTYYPHQWLLTTEALLEPVNPARSKRRVLW